MKCRGQSQVQGNGRITYHGDTFEGKMMMTTPAGKMIQHMSGTRIGECE